MKNAYNIALSDWFNPPVIQRIERKGGLIRIEARDDVMVTRVHVKILDERKKVLEEGDALQVGPPLPSPRPVNTGWWEYATQAEGKIVAQAWDLAGNRVESVLE